MKHLIITVTNNGLQDRRMQRLASTMRTAGWKVTMIGRTFAPPQSVQGVEQIRCRFRRGPLAYLEYNLRLWQYLVQQSCDVLCSVDLDTSLAGKWSLAHLNCKWIIDCHEFFEEVPELSGSPFKQWVWRQIGRYCLPSADVRWTVSNVLSKALQRRYELPFAVVHNFPLLRQGLERQSKSDRVLIYLGVLNAGRGLAEAIIAMQQIDGVLWILGEGDLSQDLRDLVNQQGLTEKVLFLGWVPNEEIPDKLAAADIGLNLLDDSSASYRLSLANKFFDYVHAGLPQVTMRFEGYLQMMEQHQVGIAVSDLLPHSIAEAANRLLDDRDVWEECHEQCLKAKMQWQWQAIEGQVVDQVDQLIDETP